MYIGNSAVRCRCRSFSTAYVNLLLVLILDGRLGRLLVPGIFTAAFFAESDRDLVFLPALLPVREGLTR